MGARGWQKKKKFCKNCGEPTHYGDNYCEDCWLTISQFGGWLTDRKWNNKSFVQHGGCTVVLGSEDEDD